MNSDPSSEGNPEDAADSSTVSSSSSSSSSSSQSGESPMQQGTPPNPEEGEGETPVGAHTPSTTHASSSTTHTSSTTSESSTTHTSSSTTHTSSTADESSTTHGSSTTHTSSKADTLSTTHMSSTLDAPSASAPPLVVSLTQETSSMPSGTSSGSSEASSGPAEVVFSPPPNSGMLYLHPAPSSNSSLNGALPSKTRTRKRSASHSPPKPPTIRRPSPRKPSQAFSMPELSHQQGSPATNLGLSLLSIHHQQTESRPSSNPDASSSSFSSSSSSSSSVALSSSAATALTSTSHSSHTADLSEGMSASASFSNASSSSVAEGAEQMIDQPALADADMGIEASPGDSHLLKAPTAFYSKSPDKDKDLLTIRKLSEAHAPQAPQPQAPQPQAHAPQPEQKPTTSADGKKEHNGRSNATRALKFNEYSPTGPLNKNGNHMREDDDSSTDEEDGPAVN